MCLRVEVDDDFKVTEMLKEVGQYAVYYDEAGAIEQVWIVLPNVGLSRIVADASRENCAKWTVTEDDQGRVTAKPSIECRMQLVDGERYFHGFLTDGVLTSV